MCDCSVHLLRSHVLCVKMSWFRRVDCDTAFHFRFLYTVEAVKKKKGLRTVSDLRVKQPVGDWSDQSQTCPRWTVDMSGQQPQVIGDQINSCRPWSSVSIKTHCSASFLGFVPYVIHRMNSCDRTMWDQSVLVLNLQPGKKSVSHCGEKPKSYPHGCVYGV